MSPRYDTQEISTLQDDFHRGVVGRISPLGLKKGTPPPFVKSATNVFFRPARAFSVRSGYRDASQVVLNEVPVSIGKHYHASGNKFFVATDAGASLGNVWLYTSASRTQQTLPWAATNKPWRFEMANGLIVGCQSGHAQPPCFYAVTNAANTWLSMALPSPPAAPTFGSDVAGGSITAAKPYYYRYRWNYGNGSSKTSAVSASHTLTSPNLTAVVNVPAPASPRADYVGWTLERTMQNGSASGPFYVVASGTASTYSDGASDASLFYEADETLHGEPVPMDGVIYHRGRLFGWYGSLLYMSQPVTGDEGTGICNWVGDAIFPIGKDDGDTIQSVVIQGERLLIGKRHSLWSLEGDDENSFRLVIRFEGAGFCGPKAAAPLGSTVFFAATDGRFFVMRGNSVEPVAAEEMGDYLRDMDTGRDAEVIALNYLGDFILFWYVANGRTYADNVLAYDLKFGNWSHHDNMPAVDAMVQKDTTDFGGATLLFADPTLLPPGNSSLAAANPSFVVWGDRRNTTNYQSYIQSLSSTGAVRLTADGVQVGNSTGAGTADVSWMKPIIVSDGGTGCIVLFQDGRSGSRSDIYAQKYNAAGVAQWTAGGVLVASSAGSVGNQEALMAACPDGSGGAVFVYDGTGSVFKAQRINSSGATQWATPTTLYTLQPGWVDAYHFTVLPAAAGAFYVSWRAVYNTSIGASARFAMKLNSDGTTAWTPTASIGTNVGVKIGTSNAGSDYGEPQPTQVISDGAGGMFIVDRLGSSPAYTFRLSRVSSSGAMLNGADGSNVGGVSGRAYGTPAICGDGSTGCWVAWAEWTAATTTLNVYARAFFSNGAAKWAAITLATYTGATRDAIGISIVPDGIGGALVSWSYVYTGLTPAGLHVARVAGNGTTVFGDTVVSATARALASPFDHGTWGRMVSDGASGAVLFWPDDRTAPNTAAASNVYAQRVRADGTFAWTAGGVAICTQAQEQSNLGVFMTGTAEADYPSGAAAGYHIWCGLSGTRDRASADGSGGDLIDIQIKGHHYDDGMPNNTKDYEWFELYVNRGKGTVIATIAPDVGTVATLALTTEVRSPKYNSGLKYNSGVKYGSIGGAKVGTGLPKGTEGRSCSVTLSAKLEDMEIGGWLLSANVLPRKDY